MQFVIASSLAAATLFQVTLGHMIMSSPVPYGKSTLNSSPLAADGSDFPCKMRGAGTYEAEGASNEWAIGSTQQLSFMGSAVHGGGSCQLSLTTDLAPTKDSKFFVIHSIEGGCPANEDGNFPADPTGTRAPKFSFTVPDGVAPGAYTFAWTWFNRIGNREMYMNCAPVTITGGAKKRAIEERKLAGRSLLKRAQFPDMFVANIGNGCSTLENGSVTFPNAGASVDQVPSPKGGLNMPVGSCPSGSGSPASPAPGTGSGSSSSASATATATPSTPTNAPPPPPASATTGAAAEPSDAAPTPPADRPSPSAAQPSPPAAQPSAPAAAPPSSGSGSSSGALTGACETGQWNCFDSGSKFQQCGSGVWSVTMATAAGAPCKVGTGASIF